MEQYNSFLLVMMIFVLIGVTADILVDDNLGISAYASSQNADLSNSLSLITLSIQNLADDRYNEGYLAGLQASNSQSQSQESPNSYQNNDVTEYYPSYNNPDYDSNSQNPIQDSIDYSKLCVDEYGNWKEPTINLSVSPTWGKSVIGSPISGSGVDVGKFDSVIITVMGSDGIGSVHTPDLKYDGTFWIFMDKTSMFMNTSLYGDYTVTVQYEDQCGFKNISYSR